jgi:hypothetical protein
MTERLLRARHTHCVRVLVRRVTSWQEAPKVLCTYWADLDETIGTRGMKVVCPHRTPLC